MQIHAHHPGHPPLLCCSSSWLLHVGCIRLPCLCPINRNQSHLPKPSFNIQFLNYCSTRTSRCSTPIPCQWHVSASISTATPLVFWNSKPDLVPAWTAPNHRTNHHPLPTPNHHLQTVPSILLSQILRRRQPFPQWQAVDQTTTFSKIHTTTSKRRVHTHCSMTFDGQLSDVTCCCGRYWRQLTWGFRDIADMSLS